jgi:hypothetical protein
MGALPAAEIWIAAWFAPLPEAPHSSAARVAVHGEHRTHADAVKAALPVGRPSEGATVERCVEPGREIAPEGEPPALLTNARSVEDE